MPRKKTGTFEDLIDIAALLPWWGGVALAIVAYIVMHSFATVEISAPTQAGQLGQFAGKQIFKTLAMFGQYLLPLAFIIGAGISAWRRRQRDQLMAVATHGSAAGAIDGMGWQEFELLVGEAFRRKGFAVTETGGGGADGGVDLVLAQDGEEFLVQCKQWRAFKVGVNVVRELYGVMAARGAAGGYVVTSGQFTPDAKQFAAGRNITLMDGDALHALIGVVKAEPDIANTGDAAHAAPLCPSCGSSMVRRVAKRGTNAGSSFWGCSGYPSCRGTRTA